jgi:transposase InsO family protein
LILLLALRFGDERGKPLQRVERLPAGWVRSGMPGDSRGADHRDLRDREQESRNAPIVVTERPAAWDALLTGSNFNRGGACLFESAFLLGFLAGLQLRAAGGEVSVMELCAENGMLRTQLAQFVSRGKKARRATDEERMAMSFWSRLFDWSSTLVTVQPQTLIGWHRRVFRLYWAWASGVFDERPQIGRPRIPQEVRDLIMRLASENRLWSPRRIADELRLKLGVRVSHRTVARYMAIARQGSPSPGQRWSTFLRNHLGKTIACDFAVAATLGLRQLYVLVVLDLETRRVLHVNATAHPTADWTIQQLREVVPAEHPWKYLIHDRDAIFSAALDAHVKALGMRALKSPPRSPKANAHCERLIGTLRRECLDHVIPINEAHLRRIVKEWAAYYNRARPHSSVGRKPPDPSPGIPVELQMDRHQLPVGARVVSRPILGGLHHDYRLVA